MTSSGGLPLVEMRGIRKRFGDTVANDGIDFDVQRGEIHVLLGENGAGKTTLMNVLFGHLPADAGTIRVEGSEVQIRSPSDAIRAGIGMVHQHFSLVPSFTVAENVMLGVGGVTGRSLRSSSIEEAVLERSRELGMPLEPAIPVARLPVDLRQRVEIVKAMYRGAEVLIMDEPTSLLGPTQIQNLLETLDTLRSRGHSIVLVTHKLVEVMEVADRVTVLRRGVKVASFDKGDFDERTLARAMTGHEREMLPERSHSTGQDVSALTVDRLVVRSSQGERVIVAGVSFEIQPGEILGIAGVEGNGQRELVDAVIGLQDAVEGRITIGGVDVTTASPADRRAAGLGVVPEDRQGLGLALDMSLAENLALPELAAGGYRRRGFISWARVRERARDLLEEFDVRPADPDAKAGSLSGGNQQKVVLARELMHDPAVLVADNPTWGLDVGAIDYVHRKLVELREKGGAVLLVTLDLEELFKLSDRVVVLYRGRLMLDAAVHQIDGDALAMAMAGRSPTG